MVRLKYAKLLMVLVFLVNAILLFYTWKWFLSSEYNNLSSTVDTKQTNAVNRQKDRNKHIKKTITIIFRDFYNFENDLHNSIDSILNLIPNIQILVIYETEPYPPLLWVSNYTVAHSNVKFINLNFDIRKTSKALSPLLQIRTKFVLFVPDSFRFGGRAIIQKMLTEIEKEPNKLNENIVANIATSDQNTNQIENNDGYTTNEKSKLPGKTLHKKIVIIPFASNVKTMSNCCRINIDFKNWTMEYIVQNDTRHCDMVIFICNMMKLSKHGSLLDN